MQVDFKLWEVAVECFDKALAFLFLSDVSYFQFDAMTAKLAFVMMMINYPTQENR